MKSTLIVVLALAMLASCSAPDQTEPPNDQLVEAFSGIDRNTNILIVSFDALRADALGIYGYDRPTSPNIDQWAEQAFVFNQFYVAGQATPTSFAAAFTGTYPFRIFRKWQLLETQTLAKVMKNAGRSTFGIFNNVQLVDERNFGQGFDDYEVFSVAEEETVINTADELLDKHRDRPFFGWVHFISPHTPYDWREMAAHLYSDDYEGPYDRTSGRDLEPETAEDADRLRELYDGEVHFLDGLFARILKLLNDHGLRDKTLIILTSDHGEQFDEHGDYGHSMVYEEVIRVPLIIEFPGRNQEQVRIERTHANTDLLPTLADVTGVDFVDTGDGVNMLDPQDPDRHVLFTAMTNKDNRAMAIRQNDDKLVVTCPPPQFEEELFDLSGDPAEQNDRILDEPGRAGKLFDTMNDMIGGDPCGVIADAVKGGDIRDNLDEETVEKLKSLGYIQ